MKRIVITLVFFVSIAHADGITETWNSLGKNNRAISGVKALITGYCGGTALHYAYLHGGLDKDYQNCSHGWDEAGRDYIFGRFGFYRRTIRRSFWGSIFMSVVSVYAAYHLLKQAFAKEPLANHYPLLCHI